MLRCVPQRHVCMHACMAFSLRLPRCCHVQRMPAEGKQAHDGGHRRGARCCTIIPIIEWGECRGRMMIMLHATEAFQVYEEEEEDVHGIMPVARPHSQRALEPSAQIWANHQLLRQLDIRKRMYAVSRVQARRAHACVHACTQRLWPSWPSWHARVLRRGRQAPSPQARAGQPEQQLRRSAPQRMPHVLS